MVTRRDYTEEAVEAARSVLVEVLHLLGEYRDNIVLVGGWIPGLLIKGGDEPHVGSMDVDIALDHREIPPEGYRTIQELLLSRGYAQGKQPFMFLRTVTVHGRQLTVEVDLLAGEYEGTGKKHRHQRVQDIHARKARGCDVALDHAKEITVAARIPGGAEDEVTCRVASIAAFLTMKGMALDDRLKEKDAWDIYYCLRNYPGGLDALTAECAPLVGHALVKEGLGKIAKHFASANSVGPRFVADFEEIADDEVRAQTQRDAHERVNAFLEALNIIQESAT